MKKALVILGKIILAFLLFILGFLIVSVAPVDRTPVTDQPYYNEMMQRIDSVNKLRSDISSFGFRVGFAKASITPSYPTSTAGYVKRKGARFTAIQDSVFVRTVVITQGNTKLALVSLDMLIVPPAVYNKLISSLPSITYTINRVHLGATHTHNSIGQWDDHFVGEVFAGEYDPELVDFVTGQILESIKRAEMNIKPAQLSYGSVGVQEAVNNRLIQNGPVDSLLHIIEFHREDGTKGLITSFTAHATCMSSKDLKLSRDYPGVLVDRFEKNGYAFAMFLAGAMGSHSPIWHDDGIEKIRLMSDMLYNKAMETNLTQVEGNTFSFHRVPLALGKQQIKFLPNWRVREWLSVLLMGKSATSLTSLRIGNLIILGTPCDFSGMLTGPIYKEAMGKNLHTLVTSFNGGYIGYITPDEYYDLKKYETQTMNWFGPGLGGYLQECMIRLMDE